MEYETQFNVGLYSAAVLEDEIFKLCVVNKFYVDTIDELSAGIVSIVVGHIMANSGPARVEDFNAALNVARITIQHPIHNAVDTICRAFSSYKPEDVYLMNYETFMLRLAMAEHRLMQIGILKEPIELISNTEQASTPSPVPKKKVDATEIAMKFANLNNTDNTHPALERAAIIKKRTGKTVIGRTEMLETEAGLGLTGHELQDIDILKQEAIKGLEHIYPEYFEMMKRGEKLSPEKMLTDEQRKIAYEEKVQKIKEGKAKSAKQIEYEQKLAPPERKFPTKKPIKRR